MVMYMAIMMMMMMKKVAGLVNLNSLCKCDFRIPCRKERIRSGTQG